MHPRKFVDAATLAAIKRGRDIQRGLDSLTRQANCRDLPQGIPEKHRGIEDLVHHYTRLSR